MLVAAFAGDISAAVFVTDPTSAVSLAMAQTATGSFLHLDAGARGGSLLGIPLITTNDSPRDSTGGQLALIDPTGIAWNVDDVQLDVAKAASLEMSDSPSGASEQVSLFQTNSAAWRVIIRANFENQRTGGVAVLTGVM
ncbi:phage major capsid family protein [Rhodanobacter lindaniclasticus]